MTKYIAFKIFDSEDYDNPTKIFDKQVAKHYTVVHEDYFVGIIKKDLGRAK